MNMPAGLVAVFGIAVLLGACTSNGASTAEHASSGGTPASSDASATGWNLLAIGDSLASPTSCEGCTDYVTLFARKIEKETGVPVRVENRAAVVLSNVPAGQVTSLYADILTDASLREAIRHADIIVISIGFNDTPWGRLDDPCDVAPNFPVVHWSKLSHACISRVVDEYKYTLDQILTEIDQLRGCGAFPGVPPCSQRGHEDTLLRIVTVYNATIGDTVDPGWDSPAAVAPTVLGDDLMVHAQCEVIRFHGGRCADIYHVFNGPQGRRAAGSYLGDLPHLSQRGNDAVARALIKLGLSPLQP